MKRLPAFALARDIWTTQHPQGPLWFYCEPVTPLYCEPVTPLYCEPVTALYCEPVTALWLYWEPLRALWHTYLEEEQEAEQAI